MRQVRVTKPKRRRPREDTPAPLPRVDRPDLAQVDELLARIDALLGR